MITFWKTHKTRRSHLDLVGVPRVPPAPKTRFISVLPLASRILPDTIASFQGTACPQAFEAKSVPEKNAVIDALKLPSTYIRAVGSTNSHQVPILQIIHTQFKTFDDITDAQLRAEALR